MDAVIIWSGWLIALGLAIWEIYKYMRNRYKVNVNISLETFGKSKKENTVVVEVSNEGRRPINLTFAGLYFKKDTILHSDELDIEVGWVYKKLPRYSFIKLKVLKDIIQSLPPTPGDVKVDGVCFLDESGDKHIGYFPENLKQVLYS